MPSSVLIGVISFLLTFGTAKKYAMARQYELDSNQELVAAGFSNAFGSIFGSIASAGRLSLSHTHSACRRRLSLPPSDSPEVGLQSPLSH